MNSLNKKKNKTAEQKIFNITFSDILKENPDSNLTLK